jgi:hypothetical protein
MLSALNGLTPDLDSDVFDGVGRHWISPYEVKGLIDCKADRLASLQPLPKPWLEAENSDRLKFVSVENGLHHPSLL